ncbi:hypothetical protein AWH62_10715 [Maricaulis sp. W15]|uniref:hypothetical protein n=1 Tax=Maricaulis sp. W15 TaxID=1772333 RepID=UPI000948C4CF|nr:hypothetical protein [Maricaulis sp. W15]OLF72299.1 hypothetical protein AWH62_10715 [Maricaulis sp. W15]
MPAPFDPAIATRATTRLETWLADAGIRLAVAPSDFAVLHGDAVDILVHSDTVPPLRVTVFDEYGDLATHDTLLALVMIGRGFAELADAADLSRWALAEGLDAADPGVALRYQQLNAARSAFLAAWGDIPDVITDLDWQLNSGAAQALRRRAGLLPSG